MKQGAVALTIGSVPRRTVFEWHQFYWLFIFNNQWKWRHSGRILRGTDPTVSARIMCVLFDCSQNVVVVQSGSDLVCCHRVSRRRPRWSTTSSTRRTCRTRGRGRASRSTARTESSSEDGHGKTSLCEDAFAWKRGRKDKPLGCKYS